MGACIRRDPSIQILTEAHQLFQKIDKNNKNYIEASDITAFFGSFGQSYVKIMMREIDYDHDGIITKNQWLGYWEMVRRAGHKPSQIRKEIQEIENGELHLNFPKTQNYLSQEPRQSVVKTIVQDLKRNSAEELPFRLEN